MLIFVYFDIEVPPTEYIEIFRYRRLDTLILKCTYNKCRTEYRSTSNYFDMDVYKLRNRGFVRDIEDFSETSISKTTFDIRQVPKLRHPRFLHDIEGTSNSLMSKM